MARSLAMLFGAGATLVLVTILLPHRDDTVDAMLAAAAGAAYVVAAVLLVLAGRVAVSTQQALLACGTVLIGVCVAYGGASATAYPLMYFWVALFASFFFAPAAAGLQIAVIAVTYAGALAVAEHPVPVPGLHWLMAIGAVGVGGQLLNRLAHAIRAQANDLTAVAQLSGGLSDPSQFTRATCASLRRSTRADAVALFEVTPDGDLQPDAIDAPAVARRLFAGRAASAAIEACRYGGKGIVIPAEDHRITGWLVERRAAGWAEPVLRDGEVAGVIAVGWSVPRWRIGERTRATAAVYATETGLTIARAELQRLDRERQALEINDTIVQGLVMAKYAAQRGDHDRSIVALEQTLERARGLITDQLRWVGAQRRGLRPGDLAREQPSSVAATVPADADRPA